MTLQKDIDNFNKAKDEFKSELKKVLKPFADKIIAKPFVFIGLQIVVYLYIITSIYLTFHK